MGLFDFLKQPKWKSSKTPVRLAAVKEIAASELDTLLEIIKDDTEDEICIAALEKITDTHILEQLARESLRPALHQAVAEKLETRYTAALLNDSEQQVQESLLQKIQDPQLLAKIAVQAKKVALRVNAVDKIHDQQLLTDLLQQACGKKPALAAVKKITDPGFLQIIADKAANKTARTQAALKLQSQSGGESSPSSTAGTEGAVSTSEQTLPPNTTKTTANAEYGLLLETGNKFCKQIELLCTNMGDGAENDFAAIVRKWPDFSDCSDLLEVKELEQTYRDLCINFSKTHKEFLNEKDHFATILTRYDRVKSLLAKDNLAGAETLLDETFADIEQTNWHWINSADISQDLIQLRQQLEQRKDELRGIASRENEQLELATVLCDQMEELVNNKERYHLDKEAKQLTEKWDDLPESLKDQHPELITRFQNARKNFTRKQQDFYKEQEWQLWTNKTHKEELCQKVTALQDDDDLHNVSRLLKEYQAAWKQIGPVPHKDSEQLWQRFTTVCDEVYARCQKFYAELDAQREQATTVKQEFCVQAEQHAQSTDWKQSADFLKELQKQWKATGPAERDLEQELYVRFRKACDTFFDRRSAFYAQQDEKRKDNLAAKEVLCREVENLIKTPTMDTGKQIQKIQKQWKTIGPVPRQNDEEIWRRFRTSCDSYYTWLDEQRQQNLGQKTALCEQVVALLPESDTAPVEKGIIDQVIAIQKKWKTIGPVPRKDADPLWKRFTSTCDRFFIERKKLQQEEEKQRRENQIAKEDILRLAGEAMELPTEQEITERLKELQQQWKEIGPAPWDHEQILWDEFHGLCNAFFAKKRERYLEKTAVLEENLKKKEELCFQLERLAGTDTPTEAPATDKDLDLAEQFKIAREANFLLAGSSENSQRKREEVRRIQQEWKQAGNTFREKEQQLWKRYRRAIDKIYADNPTPQNRKKSSQPTASTSAA